MRSFEETCFVVAYVNSVLKVNVNEVFLDQDDDCVNKRNIKRIFCIFHQLVCHPWKKLAHPVSISLAVLSQ